MPRMKGKAFLVRFADDFVIAFTDEHDARRVMDVLPKRFAKYGLTLHPVKTRLVRFGRPRRGRAPRAERPGTFDFLGFTHYWSRSRSGQRVVKRKTMSSRLTRSVQAIDRWCRAHRHDRLIDQHAVLCQKIRGHDAYYGITGNGESLKKFRFPVHRTWRRRLSRRHRKRKLDWDKFHRLLESFPLPPLRVVHSVVRQRGANVCCEEPYALMRARTDLWEPGASNRLGPPGRRPAAGGFAAPSGPSRTRSPEVRVHRAVSRGMADYGDVRGVGSVAQRLLCVAEAMRERTVEASSGVGG